jgi:uncharacterized protein YndB with AHSA1/START domain
MARKTTHIAVPPETVWDVLADGWQYSGWVVGSQKVRDVDAGWPAPGTRIHHSVGIGPLSWNDETEVLEADGPSELTLEARLRPFATARVELTLEEEDGGTRVIMNEYPVGGPLARLHSSLSELLLKGRNVESLRRLSKIVRAEASRRSRA